MDEASLQQVYKKAAENKWLYPRLFDALKDIGVERYDVDVLKFEITYVGSDTAITHPAPPGFTPHALGTFDAAVFKTALARAQKQETSYPQFLAEIAAAGIARYRVEMNTRTVAYHGKSPGETIVEPVPSTT